MMYVATTKVAVCQARYERVRIIGGVVLLLLRGNCIRKIHTWYNTCDAEKRGFAMTSRDVSAEATGFDGFTAA